MLRRDIWEGCQSLLFHSMPVTHLATKPGHNFNPRMGTNQELSHEDLRNLSQKIRCIWVVAHIFLSLNSVSCQFLIYILSLKFAFSTLGSNFPSRVNPTNGFVILLMDSTFLCLAVYLRPMPSSDQRDFLYPLLSICFACPLSSSSICEDELLGTEVTDNQSSQQWTKNSNPALVTTPFPISL